MRQADQPFRMPVSANAFRREGLRRLLVAHARRAARLRGYTGRISLSYTDLHGRPRHIIIIAVHAAPPTKRSANGATAD